MSLPVNHSWATKVYRGLSVLQACMFPGRCILCDDHGLRNLDICAGCRQDLPRNLHACLRCGLPLPGKVSPQTVCGSCIKRDRSSFDRTVAAFTYTGAMPWLITQLKFNRQICHARLLGELMWERLYSEMLQYPQRQPDLIMPMPLHHLRLRERGFNQALEIARPIAGHSGLKMDYRSLRRIRPTERQSDLSLAQRNKNMRKAFACKSSLQGLHIAVIDDVMTSGSTAAAAAQCLKGAGAARVSIWVAARAPLNAI